ncbi:retrovirus-related pol polyprotein from transposon TNT 1-94 [Tanacetum coccineum]
MKLKRLKASTALMTRQTDAEQRRPTIKKLEVKQVEFKLGEDCWDIQDKRDQQIELVNIIADPGEGMLTRSMATKLIATSVSECLFVDFLFKMEPKKVSKALKHPGWIDAMQEELNQFYRNKVWTLVPLPYVKIAIGSKWEEGIDYDETFAPVARMEAIRIFLVFATYMKFKVYQMDVKSAFLNGKLKEEVYVKLPPGFESSEFPNYDVSLTKPLWSKTSTKGMFEKRMTKKFEMSMMGELIYFLGLQIKQDEKGISISQDKYTRNVLKKYEISNRSSVKTPMVPPNNLSPDLAGKLVNETSYRGMIRYLKGTPTLGLYNPKCSGFDLKGYSDSEYPVAMSSAEAEYVDAAGCCAILHLGTKNIDIRYHFMRDHILKGDIELHFIPTEYQLADIFTKPLDEPTFTRLKAKLGMLNID